MTLSYGTECKSWLEREDCRRRDFFLPKIVSIGRDVVVDGRGDRQVVAVRECKEDKVQAKLTRGGSESGLSHAP